MVERTVYTINETYGYAWDHVCCPVVLQPESKGGKGDDVYWSHRITSPLGNGAYVIQYPVLGILCVRQHKEWNFFA